MAAILNHAQYLVFSGVWRWGFFICVSYQCQLTLRKVLNLLELLQDLATFFANCHILLRAISRVQPSIAEMKQQCIQQKLWKG